MNKVLRYALLGLLILVVFTAFIYVVKANRTTAEVYEVKKPQMRRIVEKTVATGSIVPRREVEIKPNISGIVSDVYVEAGQRVKKGDLLARIAVVTDISRLSEADSNLHKAQITLQNSQKNYERQKRLFDGSVISAADFQKVQVQYQTDRQNYLAAQQKLEIIKTGAAQGLGGAGNTWVKSTVGGTVLNVPVEVGSQVTETNNFNAGTTIASIADLGQMIFDGKVDEADVGRIETGMPVEISVGAIPDTTFKAELDFISPKGEAKNGVVQFEIKAAVQPLKRIFLRSGYSANASIVLQSAEVLAIPEALLQYDSKGEPYVEVKTAAGQYEKKNLELGISDDNYVEIKSGLRETDEIKVWNPLVKREGVNKKDGAKR